LSKEKLSFNVEGGVDSVAVENRFWLPPIIGIGDTIIYYSRQPPKYYLNNSGISYESLSDYEGNISYFLMEKTYENGEKYLDFNDVKYIEGFWFTVNRPNDKKIIFSVSENETENKRGFDITLDAGNCSGSINVIQSAE